MILCKVIEGGFETILPPKDFRRTAELKKYMRENPGEFIEGTEYVLLRQGKSLRIKKETIVRII